MPLPFLKIKRASRTHGYEDDQPDRPKPRKINKKNLLTLAATGVLALFVIGTVFLLIISNDLPDPNHLSDRQVSQSTKIYDRTGQHLLYEIYDNQKRTLIEMSEMSPYIGKAVISIEDKNFYQHNGISILSIIRAQVNNIIGRKVGGGGASTITQQLIKNTIVGDERRGIQGYFRKIKEAILAL
ncbi:MAG: transglycosylase domain-containing protein, partial [Candidatus Magasanikbacteria bacterium]|nr:transglycosylase domain-containing protein [Candidatus Magasanikbacteria bacterium]